jgi:hypothetical protein
MAKPVPVDEDLVWVIRSIGNIPPDVSLPTRLWALKTIKAAMPVLFGRANGSDERVAEIIRKGLEGTSLAKESAGSG